MTETIIHQLHHNGTLFKAMLSGLENDIITWRPNPEHWCILEIICHLRDEEVEDFRTRVKSVLTDPSVPLPKITPTKWVIERKYIEQNYNDVLNAFLRERSASVAWLKSLPAPKWENAYNHPKFGPLSAELFLNNWLAHDYLHIRQITRVKYQYLARFGNTPLQYAGKW